MLQEPQAPWAQSKEPMAVWQCERNGVPVRTPALRESQLSTITGNIEDAHTLVADN